MNLESKKKKGDEGYCFRPLGYTVHPNASLVNHRCSSTLSTSAATADTRQFGGGRLQINTFLVAFSRRRPTHLTNALCSRPRHARYLPLSRRSRRPGRPAVVIRVFNNTAKLTISLSVIGGRNMKKWLLVVWKKKNKRKYAFAAEIERPRDCTRKFSIPKIGRRPGEYTQRSYRRVLTRLKRWRKPFVNGFNDKSGKRTKRALRHLRPNL